MKEAMKLGTLRIRNQITDLNRERRIAKKLDKRSEVNFIDKRIEQLESQKVHYRAAVVPVQFLNGVVINGTLLKSYVKKLPSGPVLKAEIGEDFIKIHHSSTKGKGAITLKDNSAKYKEIVKEYPSGEGLLEELWIEVI